jgi:ArsR family transcriptional regulator
MESTAAIAALSALAHATRLDVFRMLVRAGTGGIAAGDVAGRLGVPAPTLSFHLATLSAAGLVRARRDGRSILYSADFSRLREVLDYLIEDCCRGVELAPAPTGPRRGARTVRRKKA